MYKIALFGPQGSGKGTQADLLTEHYGLFHFSPGAQYRIEMAQVSEVGKIAAQYLNAGQLAPDDVTNRLVADVLKRPEVSHGFVLDGFPRNVVQADALDQMTDLTHVFLIEISEEESISRISQRRSCPKDNSTYHLQYKAPKIDLQCDVCGTALIQRADDFPEAVRQRLTIYNQRTLPVLERYKQRGIFHAIDGRPAIAQVFAVMQQLLTGEKPA